MQKLQSWNAKCLLVITVFLYLRGHCKSLIGWLLLKGKHRKLETPWPSKTGVHAFAEKGAVEAWI